MSKLTRAEVRAICEALGARLAGPIEEGCEDREVYESAFEKMSERRTNEPRRYVSADTDMAGEGD